jgi:TonB-linked SusC/RagA family outer membrane protein
MRKFGLILSLLLCLGFEAVFAQTKTITGVVTSSEDGEPIPGVSVVVKGATLGTLTSTEGTYSLSIPADASAIVFSFVGLKSQEITYSGQSKINVTLEPESFGVEEVVVLGYVTRGKNEITGSTVQVKGEKVAGVPVTSVDQALQGKVAGLVISTSSGTPGSISDIRIRGVGSITASNEPLYVIDGVPVINNDFSADQDTYSSLSALSSLNSSDIESVTVLKDASATSAYGARGSNGVIVITTKKGKGGKTKFSINSIYGFQNDASDGLKPLTGDQKKELLLEGIYNTYGSKYGFSEEGAYDFMVEKNLDKGKLQNWNGVDGNWANEIKNKNAVVQNYDISAQGSDDVSTFYASIGYNKTEATVKETDFTRYSGKLNYNRNLSSKVKFATSASFANTVQNGILEQAAYFSNPYLTKYFMSPWEHPYTEDGTLNTDLNTSVFNTLYTLKNDINKSDLTRIISNTSLDWDIVKNLKFKTLIGLDYNVYNFLSYQNRVHGDGADLGGTSSEYTNRNFNLVAQNSLDYNYSINKHNFSAKVLLEYQKNKFNKLYGYGEKFPANGLYYISSAGANYKASSSFEDWINLSYLGMLNYNYAGKYIVDFTYRREGSSKFAQDHRFGNFYAVGAAWNLKDDLLSSVDFVDNIKLRGSVGLSGNSDIDVNQYQALLSYDENYNDEGAVYPSQYGNSDLTWEKNLNTDFGFDFAILKNRISGTFSYFNKNTYDLLQDVPITYTSGHSSITQNIGEINNHGLELAVNFDIIRKKDLNFSLGANIATVKNEVTKLAQSTSGDDITITNSTRKVEVGHPVYSWFMREWAGVNPENGNAQWYVDGKGSAVTEDYSAANQVYVGGSALPTLTGGLNAHVDYKGVFLDLNFYYSSGNKVYEQWANYTRNSGTSALLNYNGVQPTMDRWQKPGDITDVPKVIYGSNNDAKTSSRFLYDGDYLRLKDLVLGYNLPSSLIKPIGFDDITLSVRGTNVWTWVKDDRLKYDPEVRADGFTNLTTPPVKSVVFGINLKF